MIASSIDVVIPVFDGERFIRGALESVVCQTLPPDRIIVVNDGSIDRTERIVRSYPSRIPLSCINKSNGGPSSARNAGIMACKSKYIAFLDYDDIWESDKLEKQFALFQTSQYEHLGVVHCSAIKMGVGEKTHTFSPTSRLAETYCGRISELLLNANIAGSGSAVLVKRECFETIGLFDESLRLCEDWDMWLRIADRYEFDFVNENLVKIRQHQSSLSTNTDGMIAGRIVVLSKLLRMKPDNIAILRELRYQLLRLIVHRRFKVTRPDLSQYLDPGTMNRLFSDIPGMARAVGKGIVKAAKRYGQKSSSLRGCLLNSMLSM